jgi:hypothetical protein
MGSGLVNRVLKGIFGSMREQVTGSETKVHKKNKDRKVYEKSRHGRNMKVL